MSDNRLSYRVARASAWAFTDRGVYLTLQFLTNLGLARMLTPGDFGAIGMLMIFITISGMLAEGGFGSALIQKKNASTADYRAVMAFSLTIATGLYFLFWILAPAISKFYHIPLLRNLLRVYALSIPAAAVAGICTTRLRTDFNFRTITRCDVISYFTAAVAAVVSAALGAGVWSLVMLQVGYNFLFMTMLLHAARPGYPRYDKAILRSLARYGSYMLGSQLLHEVCHNIQPMFVGRWFAASITGFFSQASHLQDASSHALPRVAVQVMFPLFSRLQDHGTHLRRSLCSALGVMSFIMFPILGGIIIVAEPLVTSLYGDQWLLSGKCLRILCTGGFLTSLHGICHTAAAAQGRSREIFLIGIYKTVFLIVSLIAGYHIGIYMDASSISESLSPALTGVLWGAVAAQINIGLSDIWLAMHTTRLSLTRLIQSLLPAASITLTALAAAGLIMLAGASEWVSLLIFTLCFAALTQTIRPRPVKMLHAMAMRTMHKQAH